jgi:radical SAM protein with 4Fe4S-binding SPASM domain
MKFPRYVHLLVTYDCNFNCRQCQVNASNRKVNQLTFREITRLILEIKEAGVRHLIITGGEALIRTDIFDILEFAGKAGIPRITLATNGYLVGKYRKELASVRIDRVVISIDDVGEINDAIRGKKGAFQNALEALDIFKDIGVKSREVNTTVFPGAVSRMEELAKYIAASSATNWVLGILIPIGRASLLEKNEFEDRELMDLVHLIKKLRATMSVKLNSHTGYLKNYFQDITSEPFFCRAGREVCAINPDGEVVPCNMTTDIRFSQGNIREKHFSKIWQEGFREFRKPEYPQECKNCEFLPACGGGCWGYRLINEKFCYRDFCI